MNNKILIETLKNVKTDYEWIVSEKSQSTYYVDMLNDVTTLLSELTAEPSLEEKQAMFEEEYKNHFDKLTGEFDKDSHGYKFLYTEFIMYCAGKGWKV